MLTTSSSLLSAAPSNRARVPTQASPSVVIPTIRRIFLAISTSANSRYSILGGSGQSPPNASLSTGRKSIFPWIKSLVFPPGPGPCVRSERSGAPNRAKSCHAAPARSCPNRKPTRPPRATRQARGPAPRERAGSRGEALHRAGVARLLDRAGERLVLRHIQDLRTEARNFHGVSPLSPSPAPRERVAAAQPRPGQGVPRLPSPAFGFRPQAPSPAVRERGCRSRAVPLDRRLVEFEAETGCGRHPQFAVLLHRHFLEQWHQ